MRQGALHEGVWAAVLLSTLGIAAVTLVDYRRYPQHLTFLVAAKPSTSSLSRGADLLPQAVQQRWHPEAFTQDSVHTGSGAVLAFAVAAVVGAATSFRNTSVVTRYGNCLKKRKAAKRWREHRGPRDNWIIRTRVVAINEKRNPPPRLTTEKLWMKKVEALRLRRYDVRAKQKYHYIDPRNDEYQYTDAQARKIYEDPEYVDPEVNRKAIGLPNAPFTYFDRYLRSKENEKLLSLRTQQSRKAQAEKNMTLDQQIEKSVLSSDMAILKQRMRKKEEDVTVDIKEVARDFVTDMGLQGPKKDKSGWKAKKGVA